MRVRTIAAAKINWALEVLGKRPDGYHEIRSVMQTIDVCDEVAVWPAPHLMERSRVASDLPPGTLYMRSYPHEFNYSSNLSVHPRGILGESVIWVVRLLDPEGERHARVDLQKRIPIAAGLGGGSSDAAAALRALLRLWELELSDERMGGLAAEIGSDVAFFLTGGTALAEGRGERVTPLPDAPEAWLVVLAPPIWMPEKTKHMYGALRTEDFSDGGRTDVLAERLRRGEQVRAEDMYNAFERAAYESFAGLAGYRDRMLDAGAGSVHLAGAGPALFAVFGMREEAEGVAGRLEGTDARVFVARTLGAEEATRVEVS